MSCLWALIKYQRLFDHWAHLGGAAFGAVYYVYGPTVWQSFRRALDVNVPRDK